MSNQPQQAESPESPESPEGTANTETQSGVTNRAQKPTPEEHLANISSLLEKFASWPRTETIPVASALERCVTATVTAPYDSPRFSNSQVDGYALSQAALERVPADFLVGADIPAGTDPAEVYPDGIDPRGTGETIVPIMTGSKVPDDVAAIVRVEDAVPDEFPDGGADSAAPTASDAARRRTIAEAQPGQFIRKQGVDSSAGDAIVDAGEIISPTAIAALAFQGVPTIEVRTRARILIATGGAEVAETAEVGEHNGGLGAAIIPDANFPMMAAQAQRFGIEVVGRVHIDDDVDKLAARLRAAIEQHRPDVVVTSGGISKGKYEVVRQLLGDAPDAWFGAVSQQPGGPQGYGSFCGVPCVCLPGNPVSSLVSFRLFVAPLLGTVPAPIEVIAGETLTGLADKDQFVRARLDYSGGHVRAHVVSGPGSHLLQQAVAADALLRIPAGATISARQRVLAYRL
ncbi:molybdopterin molybdotransferase MoeA [Corynebacterium sp. MNWGS58]|uniref:molybdopterin molybdotransferase MoeA n=1 Tax=Corynebacterium sp. 102791.4 TaxID=3104612 RepID=UPI0035114B01